MNKYLQKSYILLWIIILLASFLRIYHISSVPSSLYWDEAAIGYNAYSIAETGKDEYGNMLPILFRSFDDYKMPGYIYTSAVFIKLFGLNEFSVRIASSLFGILSVLLTYFLVLELFTLGKKNNPIFTLLEKNKLPIALLSAFFLSISPWHLQFSRTGFEANGGLFFLILGVLFFLVGRRKVTYFFFSFISFAAGMYFYRSLYIVIPLMLFSLCITFFSEYIRVKKRYLITGIVLFFLLLIPIVPQMFSENGLARARQVGITSILDEKLMKSSQKIANGGNKLLDRIFYNRRLVVAETYVQSYISHFTLDYLFFSGDTNGRHGTENTGLLYMWEIPFVITGLLLCFFLPLKMRLVLLLWLIFSPIAASLSVPTPHALRSLNMLPIPQILSAIGCVFIVLKISRLRFVVSCCLASIIGMCFIVYMYNYYIITPIRTADDWADGYKQLVTCTASLEKQYDKIIITGGYWQPYIYFLFYSSYDPTLFQKFGSNFSVEKYYFGGTTWDKEKGREGLETQDLSMLSQHEKTLIALTPEEYMIHKDKLTYIATVMNSFGKARFILGKLR